MVHTIANVTVGRADVGMSKAAHVRGVREGNRPGDTHTERGLVYERGGILTGRASRSTGINPEDREPIDPRSPNLSPA